MTAAAEPAAPAPDRHDLLALACDVACQAGQLLAERSGQPVVVTTKSSPTDVVTEMDQAAELLIRQRILAARPGDAILGEEGGQTGPREGSAVRWIVDPLDGTVNYLYGLPDWAVSVAAEVDGVVVAGAVCIPKRDDLFGAVLAAGAWRTNAAAVGVGAAADGTRWRPPGAEPLACKPGVRLSRALIATGFGYEPGRRAVQGRVLSAVLPRVRDIRRNGACAVDLCSLAAGNVDGYFERGVQYWDTAAGSLIAREAGAVVGGLAGKPAGPSMTLGAGPALFAELHDLLLSLDPERDA
ncbi:MAG TPA: inositol monophosphatase family protein [Streptosporangiaceae bacterium]|nr:inositol monophosphatase family protein [Streptosporangiaceae bacterium]